MPAVVIIGAQWGDEGKGKATDLIADRIDSNSTVVTTLVTPSSSVMKPTLYTYSPRAF
jgi:2-keto-4-pentenoate hydratase